ncbi:restriction endonuclease [Brachybacterium sp. SGAir0954]|uniref:McrC family protein n=1 Tax=Brachybacterium sp. SGAir0954 TaxID=2571029 RepID=UPI0010CCC848|nr:restriction endonuclease [Brachybacterium sp. SGAir0954]QCR52212.1 restriction endonuclease [Brachybacterium sp. SGAir0954]
MRRLELTEGAPAHGIELTEAEARAVALSEIAELNRAPGETGWQVAPGRKIGVVQVDDLQISVTPKIPVERLIFLMGYATAPAYWREHSVQLDPEESLPEALAHAFTRLAQRATEQGLLQGYRTVDDSLQVLRGRIRVSEQIGRRHGAGLPLEVTYDDFTVDVTENQILLAAVTKLLRIPGLDARRRPPLQRLRLQLAGVAELRRGEVLPRWTPSRLNSRYVPALRLAERILAGESFEQRRGELHVSGFVLDMWKIYEDFVGVALREALASRGSASLQHRMHLDIARRVDLRPDFLWTSHEGQQIVVDAKYKSEKPAGYPQADLYQLLAYCTVLGLREGHLVYAKGNEVEVVHEIRGADVAIHCHTLDLDQPPHALLDQIASLAARLAD